MRARRLSILFAGTVLLAGAPATGGGDVSSSSQLVPPTRVGPTAPTPAPDELEDLYRARDYFGLRNALERSERAGPPRARFLRAAVLHAFNEPETSNAVVEGLLAEADLLPDTLAARAHRLRYHNFLRLHRYGDAVSSGEAVLDVATAEPETRQDVRNELRALRAIRGTAPQEVVRREPTVLHGSGGRIPVSVDGSDRRYALDTGANFSVLMRSEARALGLEIREAGVELGTATDVRVIADVAVAQRVRMGGIEIRNVVFLVLPDAALTFAGGYEVRGVIGFPVLEALGVLRFDTDGTVEVPAWEEPSGPANLALEQLTPLVRVGFRGEDLVCRLDTGAGRTNFYEPFVRDHRDFVERYGEAYTAEATGAGGVREVRAYRLPSVRLQVAGRNIGLEGVDAYSQPLADEGENYLACNVGRDLLDRSGGYVIDFRSMSLTLF